MQSYYDFIQIALLFRSKSLSKKFIGDYRNTPMHCVQGISIMRNLRGNVDESTLKFADTGKNAIL